MAGLKLPDDRVIDGKDQSAFLFGQQEESSREGFLYWNGPRLFGVKWRNFKLALVEQRSMFDPAPEYGFPNIRNLAWDPKETQPVEPRYFHTWRSSPPSTPTAPPRSPPRRCAPSGTRWLTSRPLPVPASRRR